MRKLLLTALLMVPALAQAEPWCLHIDERIICNYTTAEACYNVASNAGGSCRPNARELGVRGDAPICMITASYRYCTFYSYRWCRLALEKQEPGTAGCVENTEKALEFSRKGGKSFTELLLQEDIGVGAGP